MCSAVCMPAGSIQAYALALGTRDPGQEHLHFWQCVEYHEVLSCIAVAGLQDPPVQQGPLCIPHQMQLCGSYLHASTLAGLYLSRNCHGCDLPALLLVQHIFHSGDAFRNALFILHLAYTTLANTIAAPVV